MRTLLAIITLCVTLGACSRREDSLWSIELRDGIEVRVYHSSYSPALDPYELGESTLFGTDQSADTYLWRYAAPARVLPDGNLLIADGRSETGMVHRFSPDGRFLNSFGRTGEGPGELMGAYPIFLLGDTIGISDNGNKRMSFFDLHGRYLSQLRMPTGIAGYTNLEIMPLPRSRFLLVSLDGRGLSATDSKTVFRWSFIIQELNQNLEPVASAVDSIYDQEWVMLNDRYLFISMNRTAPVSYAAAPHLPIAWVESDKYRIEFMDVGSNNRYAVELPHDPVQITADIRNRFIDSNVELGYSREGLNRLKLPSHLPATDILLWDDEARLWVRDFTSDYASLAVFNVFSREGEWLFRQHLPQTPSLIEKGSIYYSDEDDAGNPLVRQVRLVERGSSLPQP